MKEIYYKTFMNIVFGYASTLSLAQELKQQELKNIKPEDVFICGGSPGHAVIVVDVAQNKNSKELELIRFFATYLAFFLSLHAMVRYDKRSIATSSA